MAESAVRLGGDAIIGAREEQQDAFAAGFALLAAGRKAKLAVVVDGMGGHVGGAIAANVALAAFLRAAESGRWATFAETLRASLDAANQAIAARIELEPRYRGMGCTLVAAIFDDARLWTISVGDSLLLRVASTGLERLNADHSMAPLLDPAVASEDANHQRHLLRSALTGGAIALIDERVIPLSGDARIVLASDGLLTLDPAAILDVLLHASGREPERQAELLLQAVQAKAQPDQDNCTIIVVECRNPAASRLRPLRIATGAVLLAVGVGALGYAWWSIGGERAHVAGPNAGAVQSAGAPPPASSVRRDGYPQAQADVAAAAEPTTTPVAPRSVAGGKPTPGGRKDGLVFDTAELIAKDDRVTAPPKTADPTPAGASKTAPPASSSTPAPSAADPANDRRPHD